MDFKLNVKDFITKIKKKNKEHLAILICMFLAALVAAVVEVLFTVNLVVSSMVFIAILLITIKNYQALKYNKALQNKLTKMLDDTNTKK